MTFTYDVAGRVIEQGRNSGGASAGKTERSFDAVGNLSRLTHSGAAGQLFADTRYSHDGTVRLIGEQRLDQNVSYSYDADWQLTGADYTGQADENRTYDALGNLAGATVGPNNRLLSDSTFDYRYDDEGNQTRKVERATGEVTEYAFDLRNRLTQVTRQSAGGILLSDVSHRYDGFGRLIERNENGVVLRTVYDDQHAWADLSAADAVTARYLLGGRMDELLARWRAVDGFAWYLTDHQGTVQQLVNGAGTQLVNGIQYTAFGGIVGQTNPSAGDRFAYTGREWEAVAGLYYYRARFYDAGIGRFISQDPIGFEGGDANLYRYTGNTVTTLVDPDGLTPVVSGALFEEKVMRPMRACVNAMGYLVADISTRTGIYVASSFANGGAWPGMSTNLANRASLRTAFRAVARAEIGAFAQAIPMLDKDKRPVAAQVLRAFERHLIMLVDQAFGDKFRAPHQRMLPRGDLTVYAQIARLCK